MEETTIPAPTPTVLNDLSYRFDPSGRGGMVHRFSVRFTHGYCSLIPSGFP
ncbi:hypothetical protein [Petrimonas sp.]|uniref:hypothetical protein n=1 Tax=Petrimonas sp. TaxID=2023866 RepID=UPI003F519290